MRAQSASDIHDGWVRRLPIQEMSRILDTRGEANEAARMCFAASASIACVRAGPPLPPAPVFLLVLFLIYVYLSLFICVYIKVSMRQRREGYQLPKQHNLGWRRRGYAWRRCHCGLRPDWRAKRIAFLGGCWPGRESLACGLGCG